MRIYGLIMLAFLSLATGSLSAADTPSATSAAPVSATTARATVSVAGASASTGSASDWPQWHGPNRNAISPESITWPAAGPKQLWKAAVGDGYSCVAVSKGRAYTMGNTNNIDTVWCFDAKTGAEVWKYSYACPNSVTYGGGGHFPGPRATPTIDGNLVYTVGLSGSLLALDAAKGTLVWSADFQKDFKAHMNRWGFACSPLVDGKLLLVNVGGKGAFMVAFDKTTGQVVWKSGDNTLAYGAPAYGSPVVFTASGKRIVAMFSFVGLYGYDLADGKELWKTEWPKGHDVYAADPVPLGDKLFLPYIYGTKFGLYQTTDHSIEVVYTNSSLPPAFSGGTAYMVSIGGLLYGYSGNWEAPSLVCLDPATGDVKWKKIKLGGPFIAAGNKLIFIRSAIGKTITDTGHLIVAEASPEGYKEIGNIPLLTGQCWTAPSLAHGLVYCRNTKGDVVCLDFNSPER